MKHCATYLRVSTQRQGSQGLGISAQRSMCENFIKQNKYEHIKEFMDVESGTHRDRKGLWDAITFCKENNCILVIAKLDRLARDVEFTFKVINTGIDIHFTDMPVVNSMVLGVFAAVAQYEREMCSKRTKQALQALKARGEVKLGGSNETWKHNYYSQTEEERRESGIEKGKAKRARHQSSREFLAFKKILMKVFPEYTKSDDAKQWIWGRISLRGKKKDEVLEMMKTYKDFDSDGQVFSRFDFDNNMTYCRKRIHPYMQAFRLSCQEVVRQYELKECSTN